MIESNQFMCESAIVSTISKMEHSNTYITHSMSIKNVNGDAPMLGIAPSKANLPSGVRSRPRWREGRDETGRGESEPPATHPAPPQAAGRKSKQEGMSDRGVDDAVKPTVLL